MKNDLLKLLDLSGEDIITILNTADQLKYETKHNIHKDYLKGKTLAMIFEKNSTRTRVSFETGMYQLGGHRPGAGPVLRRHYDPHLRPGGGGAAGPVHPDSRD